MDVNKNLCVLLSLSLSVLPVSGVLAEPLKSLTQPVETPSNKWTQSSSQDECSIWLCLPAGFPSGCSAAFKAMKKRVKKLKPPLPSFSSCAAPEEGQSKMSSDWGYSAVIGAHSVCVAWESQGDQDFCGEWKAVPQHYIQNTRCNIYDGISDPPKCVTTAMWAEVYVDGVKQGKTYHWYQKF